MGPPGRLAGRLLDARPGRDDPRPADGGRGGAPGRSRPGLLARGGLAAYQLIDPILKLVAGPALTQEGATTLAAMGYPVMSLVLKILVVVCGLAAVLKLFDFDVGTVLAGLGIGGLAFALAAQDTLKNFFGSLMLIADRTFRVGDLVQIGAQRGGGRVGRAPHHPDPRARRLAPDDPQLRPDHRCTSPTSAPGATAASGPRSPSPTARRRTA